MAKDNLTYLDNVNTDKVNELLNKTENNVEYFNSVSDQVVSA